MKNKKLLNPFFWVCLLILLCAGSVHAQIERWVYRYNGPADSADIARSIIYGADGNLYVAGYSSGRLASIDFTVISLTNTGTENWVYRYDGPVNDRDEARSIAYGADSNIYAAGYSRGSSTDFAVISLTTTGDTNWVYRYNGPVDATDEAYAIVSGTDGNLYVAGGSYLTVGRATDFTVISLASSGTERWVYQYDGGMGALDIAYSIACGEDSNIYAAGNCWYGSGRYWDFTIISLPPSGPPQNWVYKYDGPGSEMDNSDAAYAITYGSDGNIYAAGKSYGSGTWRDFTTVSVTTSGAQRWVYRQNGSANLDDRANSIIYGRDGNVYVAGYIQNSNDDIIVASIPSSGPPVNWVYIYNGPGDGDDAASSIIYGSDGNVYVAGTSVGSDASADFVVISLGNDGTERWIYRYNGPMGSGDGATSIVYGNDGYIYAAGYSTASGAFNDFTVISLDPITGVKEGTATPISDKIELLSTFFNDKIFIRFANASEFPLKIIIYDVLGIPVYEASFSTTPSLLHLDDVDISKLSEGIYFIQLQTGDRNITRKVIKTR